MRRYDTLVVGGGMAGLPLALRAARHGRTAFVERELLGGTCLNRGCIPTKTMVASAKVAQQVRRAAEFGVHADGLRVDLGDVVDRRDGIVESIRSGSYRAVDRHGDLDLMDGHGRFTGTHRLEVDGTTIAADRIFLNTGTRDRVPPIDGLNRVPYLTSRTILDLRELPEHLVVVDGGFIGVEFAQMFRRFGARVTVVQRADRLVPTEDSGISTVLADVFADEGIDVLLATTCAVDGEAGAIRVGRVGTETGEVTGSHLLVATGRTPNTENLGVEHLGLDLDDRGFVPVDGQLRTAADGVSALGDLRGHDMFTHTARDDADAAVGTQPFTGVARATAIGETRGSITFIADATTDRVLGCHIIGPDGGNLIHEAVIAMVAGASYSDIGRAIHVHPTLAEGVNAAAGGVHRPSQD